MIAVLEAFGGQPAVLKWVANSGGDAVGHLAIHHAEAMGHHPVDRLLPQSNLQRMKLLFEGEDGAEAKAPEAGVMRVSLMAGLAVAGTMWFTAMRRYWPLSSF